jgi:sigma-B regulation protein RsbU (phosphoserine phosphatase)
MAKMSFESAFKQTKSPSAIMELVNNDLCAVTQASMFLTAFVGLIDLPAGTITYSRAGHCFPAIFSALRPENPVMLKEGSPIIGNSPEYSYPEYTAPIQAGDRLFLYTDGIIEIRDHHDRFFDKLKLFDIIKKGMDRTIEESKQAIIRAIEDFVQGDPFEDDITFLFADIKSTGPQQAKNA